jgi:hypothetical protein
MVRPTPRHSRIHHRHQRPMGRQTQRQVAANKAQAARYKDVPPVETLIQASPLDSRHNSDRDDTVFTGSPARGQTGLFYARYRLESATCRQRPAPEPPPLTPLVVNPGDSGVKANEVKDFGSRSYCLATHHLHLAAVPQRPDPIPRLCPAPAARNSVILQYFRPFGPTYWPAVEAYCRSQSAPLFAWCLSYLK